MNPLELIALHEPQFTKSDTKIKDYVLNNLDIISSYPITTVANKTGVSKSALLRFCQKLGYNGYSEFKYEVTKHLLSGTFYDPSGTKANQDIVTYYINCIQKLPDYISEDTYFLLCRLIKNASKIKVFGLHESGLSAQYLTYRLATLGIDSEPLVYSGSFSEKASFARETDLNIFISVSGITESILDASRTSFERGAKTVLITQNSKALLADQYDCFISIPSMDYAKNQLFLDSQAIFFITIDLIISKLSKQL